VALGDQLGEAIGVPTKVIGSAGSRVAWAAAGVRTRRLAPRNAAATVAAVRCWVLVMISMTCSLVEVMVSTLGAMGGSPDP